MSTSEESDKVPDPRPVEKGTDTYYTVKEAAAVLKVSTATILRLCRLGKLPALDLGTGRHHEFRIRADALVKLKTLQSPPQPKVYKPRRTLGRKWPDSFYKE